MINRSLSGNGILEQQQVRIPASKSISNRALLAAALANGTSKITHVLDADDTQHMIKAIRNLGIKIKELDLADEAGNRHWEIEGSGGHWPAINPVDLFVGNAGTLTRFILPTLAFAQSKITLTGDPRMYHRPIGPLTEKLASLGIEFNWLGEEGFLPLEILPWQPNLNGEIHISLDGTISSQFISAMLYFGVLVADGMTLERKGKEVSEAYVQLTVDVLNAFGAAIETQKRHWKISPKSLEACDYSVEADASSASYFFALGAIDGPLEICGVSQGSTQSDLKMLDVLQGMGAEVQWLEKDRVKVSPPADGCLKGVDWDLSEMTDIAMTLGAVALFAKTPSHFFGLENMVHKESDRLRVFAHEASRLGADVMVEGEGAWRINGANFHKNQTLIPTYDDHRVAMSFAVLGTYVSGIEIENAQCCGKTFPLFFEILQQISQA